MPRLRQPNIMPFDDWRKRHAYLLWSMHRCLRLRTGTAHGNVVWDWDGVMTDLARYAYQTSVNRYRSYILRK